MKRMKRMLSTLLAVVLAVGLLTVPSFAATSQQETKAKALFEMGLFMGYDTSGSNFGLNDKVTREQALILFIRMMGEETAAKAWTGALPYTDVPKDSFALPYIGYAKEKGYTVGIGNNKFGLNRIANMNEMTTFALRGLGYSDLTGNPRDFSVSTSVSFAKSLGLLESDKVYSPFLRGNAVDIIFGALGTNMKGQEYDLLSKLMDKGTVTQAQYDKALAVMGATDTVTGVSLNKPTATVAVGTTVQMTATVAPATAANKAVTWSSGSSSIATVSSTGLVKGVKAGTAVITVTTQNGKKTAACTITVTSASVVTGSFKVWNNTGKSITELYVADSAASGYGKNWLSENNYNSLSDKKYVTVPFEFYKDTNYDFFIRCADGTELEATDVSFAGFTSTGGEISLRTDKLAMIKNGSDVRTVKWASKTADLTARSKALTDRYNKDVTRYQNILDQYAALGLDKDAEFVKSVNALTTEVNKIGAAITKGGLTAAQITEYDKSLGELETVMTTLEGQLKDAAKPVDTTAASKALTDRYNKSVVRYNNLVAEMRKITALTNDQSFINSMNNVSNSIDAMGRVIGEGTGVYTETQISEYNTALDALDSLMNDLDKLVAAAKAEANKPTSITAPITIVNATGADFPKVYMTPSGTRDWGTSIGTLPNASRASTSVTFTPSTLAWDLRVEDLDGQYLEFYNIDFTGCKSSGGTITLTYDAATGKGTATTSW